MPRVFGFRRDALRRRTAGATRRARRYRRTGPVRRPGAEPLRASAIADGARRHRRLRRRCRRRLGAPAAMRRSTPTPRGSSRARRETCMRPRWCSASSTRCRERGWDFRTLPGSACRWRCPSTLLAGPRWPRRAAPPLEPARLLDRAHPSLRAGPGARPGTTPPDRANARRARPWQPSPGPDLLVTAGVLRDGAAVLHPVGPDRPTAGRPSTSPAAATRRRC